MVLKVKDTDNQDLRTTILVLEDGTEVEVDPVSLFVDAVQKRERAGSIYLEPIKTQLGEKWVLNLGLVFETDQEHDEDSDSETVQIELQNEPMIYQQDYS